MTRVADNDREYEPVYGMNVTAVATGPLSRMGMILILTLSNADLLNVNPFQNLKISKELVDKVLEKELSNQEHTVVAGDSYRAEAVD